MKPPLLLAVMGPTASGKTDFAERMADRLDAQLINADAFQIYIGMDIGTAKPAEKERYELLDIKTPNETYGVGEFVSRATEILERLYARRQCAIVVGGTGLYIRALMEAYDSMRSAPDPNVRQSLNDRLIHEGLEALVRELTRKSAEEAERVDLKNPIRVIRALERLDQSQPQPVRLPPFKKLKVALLPESFDLRSRIAHRVDNMMQNGWVREVRALIDAGYGPKDPGFRAIGYRQLREYLEGQVKLEETIATTIAETCRYAKRQRTWLRSEPNLNLLEEGDPFHQAVRLINSV